MPILFSLPIFFQVIFKLLGVEFNLKRELIAYANTGFSGIYAQPTYYFDDHADHKYNKINQSQDTLNIHLEHELYFDHRE